MVKVDSHHLKLYSEYWTALSGDGEGRVLGSVVGFGVCGEAKIRFLHCPVRLRSGSGRNDEVLGEASRDNWLRLPPGDCDGL
jgi:hypothetical protein